MTCTFFKQIREYFYPTRYCGLVIYEEMTKEKKIFICGTKKVIMKEVDEMQQKGIEIISVILEGMELE